MRYFDGEIKHLDGYKFNSGERVKFFARNHNVWSNFYDGVDTDKNRPSNIWSTLYDGVETDENCRGRKLKEEQQSVLSLDGERPIMESWNGLNRDDWND